LFDLFTTGRKPVSERAASRRTGLADVGVSGERGA
jgi:hypothetical protein